MRARPAWGVAAGVLGVLIGAGGTLAAQVPDSATTVPRVGCLRGEPRPMCASFWLIELQGSTTLMSPSYWVHGPDYSFRIDESEAVYELTLGHMSNLDLRWAVGGGVSLGTGANDAFTGVRGRVRRWLTPNLSVELEAGLARGRGHYGWYAPTTGFSTGLRFNIQDYGSAFVRYDGYGAGDPDTAQGPPPAGAASRSHFVRGGIGLGSKAAIVGTGVVVVGYGVLFALYALSGGFS